MKLRREELEEKVATDIVEAMDVKVLIQYVYEDNLDWLKGLSNHELIDVSNMSDNELNDYIIEE